MPATDGSRGQVKVSKTAVHTCKNVHLLTGTLLAPDVPNYFHRKILNLLTVWIEFGQGFIVVIYHTYIHISSYMSRLIVDSETLLIKDKKQKQQISTYIHSSKEHGFEVL